MWGLKYRQGLKHAQVHHEVGQVALTKPPGLNPTGRDNLGVYLKVTVVSEVFQNVSLESGYGFSVSTKASQGEMESPW